MNILFYSRGHAECCVMAEAFARSHQSDRIGLCAAVDEPHPLSPECIKAMAEVGIDVSGAQPGPLVACGDAMFDVVITMCQSSARDLPALPGLPARVHWRLPDRATLGFPEENDLDVFRRLRDEIQRLVKDFFERGYEAALAFSKRYENLILDNISDGIIAHDMQRRIFHFNSAAERITGYGRAEVLNRDCHEVFPGNFCGGKCMFCDADTPPRGTVKHEQLEIVSKHGERRLVDMTVRVMHDIDGAEAGVLASFHDVTRETDLARRMGEIHQFSGIIGRDDKMLEIFDLIRDLAGSDVPVLIQGESGTGKELVAAAIHNEGLRRSKLFIPVNCGALPESLLESELFGHVKGSFTGAIRDKKGRFELADGGTIFLDEIGDISAAMQVKLMRVLQEGTFERVGSEETLKVNVRVISATNKNLQHEIMEGRFRDDLYYRLSVVPIWLPPLRERRNDIPLIAEQVLGRIVEAAGRSAVTLSPETMDTLLTYEWPGNVRELQNWIQFALVKCKGDTLLPEHLPPARGIVMPRSRRRRSKLDRATVDEALRSTQGNKVEAARLLGVSRATLYRFLADQTSG